MDKELLEKAREAFEKSYDIGSTWLVERSCYEDSGEQANFKKFADAFHLGYLEGLEGGSVLSPS